jgi:hypothetical protein
MERRRHEAQILGSEVATDKAALHELMPEIVAGKGDLLWPFGMGLARGADDQKELWQEIVEQFDITPDEQRDTPALRGFLAELSANKSPLCDELLDAALMNEPLAPYFPDLQTSVLITTRGIARLIQSVELGRVPIRRYFYILLGSAIEVVPAVDIASFITSVAKRPDGIPVAIRLLETQFFSDRQDQRVHSTEIIEAGRAILQSMDFDRRDRAEDYHLHGVVAVCASGDKGYDVAKRLCSNLRHGAVAGKTYGFDHNQLLRTLFKVQPKAALNALLTGEPKAVTAGTNLINQSTHLRDNPVDEITEGVLFEWCAEDREGRFPTAAAVVSAFSLTTDRKLQITADESPRSWDPIVSRLVHSAPDPLVVMQVFVDRVHHTSGSGSRSTLLRNYAALFDQFDVQGNVALAAFINRQAERFQQEAHEFHDWETKLDHDRDERFE